MNEKVAAIKNLSDGKTKSSVIAQRLGLKEKYVQKIWKKYDMPRPPRGQPPGPQNTSWRTGRQIDLSGYVWVRPGFVHPGAVVPPGKKMGKIMEHRLVAEKMLGRYLKKTEVVDHIDGCRLNNDPSNLRIFSSNAEHLKATLKGKLPSWSAEGLEQMRGQHLSKPSRLASVVPVDSYRLRKERGAVRLLQILLAHERLGKDSPFLLGTERYLEKAGISFHPKTNKPVVPEYLQEELTRLLSK